MTDEAAFQAALDERPADHALRLVFADWLEERGDWRAAGYRWMGECRQHPRRAALSWDWWDLRWLRKYREAGMPLSAAMLESSLFERLDGYATSGPNFREYTDRRAAEEALCRALRS